MKKPGFEPRPLRERLLARVQMDGAGGCWLWQGYIMPNGYAKIWVNEAHQTLFVHRVAYELFVGAIPEGLQIDHLCRVRHCVNPDHLEAVPQGVNLRRGEGVVGVNHRKTACQRGHLFTAENTYRTSAGHRRCRRCHREGERARFERAGRDRSMPTKGGTR